MWYKGLVHCCASNPVVQMGQIWEGDGYYGICWQAELCHIDIRQLDCEGGKSCTVEGCGRVHQGMVYTTQHTRDVEGQWYPF